MNLSTVRYSIRTVFFVTFKSLTVLGTSLTSHIVLDFNMYFDLRKSMLEIDLKSEIHQKSRKETC